MQPSEEQIVELMTSVNCTVCGAQYHSGDVEVLGHREALWFVRVRCAQCASRGLIAAMVSPADDDLEGVAHPPATSPVSEAAQNLDLARKPGPIGKADVTGMRKFLAGFDGDFQGLFQPTSDAERRDDAA